MFAFVLEPSFSGQRGCIFPSIDFEIHRSTRQHALRTIFNIKQIEKGVRRVIHRYKFSFNLHQLYPTQNGLNINSHRCNLWKNINNKIFDLEWVQYL